MRKLQKIVLSTPVIGLVLAAACFAQTTRPTDNKPDLRKEPTLYVVGYAHLDTEWRWEYPSSVIGLVLAAACFAQTTRPTDNKPDLRKEPTLYVVGYAHLDTEWRWEYP